MDKYKTSTLGRALKSVFRGEITTNDCVNLAKEEIREVFSKKEMPLNADTDKGFAGDLAGLCPLCGKEVVRTKFGYGCTGYKEGCKFSVSGTICKRAISLNAVKELLTKGRVSKIDGFVSPRTGKEFSAGLKLENGKINFVFD